MADLNHGILGIDISKLKFDVALMVAGKIKKTHIFENAPSGFKALSNWLLKQGITTVSACMEATGCYGDALATYLYGQGFTVSVVNPAQIKSLSGAQLKRAKTDKADATLIAQFYLQMNPAPWTPPPLHVRELQVLVQRLAALTQMEGQEQNRKDTANTVIQPSIATVLATLKAEIKIVEALIHDHIDRHPDLKDRSVLLESIPGIGKATWHLWGMYNDSIMPRHWLHLLGLIQPCISPGVRSEENRIYPRKEIRHLEKRCICQRLWQDAIIQWPGNLLIV